jgi:hypothetical protein
MIYDVSKFLEFQGLEELSYEELIEKLRWIKPSWYKERKIYFETHHVIPKCEGNKDNEVVYLPVRFHFLAHLKRAMEYEKKGDLQNSYRNYAASWLICHSSRLKKISFISLKREVEDMMIDFEGVYGVSEKVRRNFLLIKQDPRKQMKEVICLETGEVFESLNQAAKMTGVSPGNLSMCLNGKRRKVGGLHWSWKSENKSLSEILDDEKKSLKERLPIHYTMRIIQVETNKVFIGLKEIEKEYMKYSGHVIDCCDGKRKTALGYHWRYDDTKN